MTLLRDSYLYHLWLAVLAIYEDGDNNEAIAVMLV